MVPEEAVLCSDPVSSLQFEDQAEERGLLLPSWLPNSPAGEEGRGLSSSAFGAEDYDGDGDIDIVVFDLMAHVYLNDGTGHFEVRRLVEDAPSGGGNAKGGMGDFDGDGHVDLVLAWRHADGRTRLQSHLQGPEGLLVGEAPIEAGEEADQRNPSLLTLGDLDGDGLLDLHIANGLSESELPNGHPPELLYLGTGVGFGEDSAEFVLQLPDGGGLRAQAAAMSDVDQDGDLDLWLFGGGGGVAVHDPPTALFMNESSEDDGALALIDRASELGLAVDFPGMGHDVGDLNGDGGLDYCVSDVGPPRCFFSDGQGGLAEVAGSSLGLSPGGLAAQPVGTIGWAVDFSDFNNDGYLDVVHASGYDNSGTIPHGTLLPDLLWLGGEEGFVEASQVVGLGSDASRRGLLSADFDGDGALDVLAQADEAGGVAKLYMNRCGEGGWVAIELVGPPPNTMGIGARVRLDWTDGEGRSRSQVREVAGPRALNQTPTRVHQGLGEAVEVRVEVVWPDGSLTRGEALPTRRVITVVHEAALLD